MRAQGVVLLVLLVEDAELQQWSDPGLAELGAAAGVDVRRYPIPDGSAPTPELMDRIQAEIDVARAHGDVAVACMGGVGRTGTVGACALVGAGLDPDAAIARVREVRHPEAVETAEQEGFVRAFAAARAERR
jgi:protein-tyrosine phosphatase